MESLVFNERIDTKDLNEQANMLESFKKAMDIIEEYKEMIPSKQKEHTQQTFVGLEDVLKTSSTPLQRNSFTSSKTSGRRLAKTF